jgi:hypothetical protein
MPGGDVRAGYPSIPPISYGIPLSWVSVLSEMSVGKFVGRRNAELLGLLVTNAPSPHMAHASRACLIKLSPPASYLSGFPLSRE